MKTAKVGTFLPLIAPGICELAMIVKKSIKIHGTSRNGTQWEWVRVKSDVLKTTEGNGVYFFRQEGLKIFFFDPM